MIKRILILAAGSMALFAQTALCAGAPGTQIHYSKASAYINNHPIPCYNINDYCYVYVKDLQHYGFDVYYDGGSDTVTISRSDAAEIAGIADVSIPYQSPSEIYAVSGDSSIRVIAANEECPSYWVDGYMMVLLDSLGRFGGHYWDSDRSAMFVTVDGLPSAEYAPIPKAKRQYTRQKLTGGQVSGIDHSVYPNAERNWGFQRVEHDEPILYDWEKAQLAAYDAYYIDPEKPHALYFTFDEGYEAGYTPQILDVLEKYNIPATFFVTGDYLDSSPDLVSRMISSGFSVGNHTSTHPNLARASKDNVIYEIESVSDRLREEFGYETYYMRPPEGAFSERVLAIARDMGYNTILWSFAYKDYDTSDQKGADYAYDMMTRYMHNGAIYLIHAVSRDNANALERVILYALENGYEFRSLDDLCRP